VGTAAFDVVRPEDRDRVRAAFEDLVGSPGTTECVEYRFRERRGE
jgi:hypothetical protein